MGIFPSYYEPWGYTPMECIALGVPAVTSDLSGFGAYVAASHPRPRAAGHFRAQPPRAQVRRRLTTTSVDHLVQFLASTAASASNCANKVERLGEMFDWSTLVRHYDEAHDLALQRIGAPRQGKIEIRFV